MWVIRDKAINLPTNLIENIFKRKIYKKNVSKKVFNSGSKVVPYWEATRKMWNKKFSIEYPILGHELNIKTFYNWTHSKKSWLDKDISLILEIIWEKEFNEFWEDFAYNYLKDYNNI